MLVPTGDEDLQADPSLTQAERGMLGYQRKRLRKLLTDGHWRDMRTVALVDEILRVAERVLNPAAHGGTPPLYKGELDKALALVKQLAEVRTG